MDVHNLWCDIALLRYWDRVEGVILGSCNDNIPLQRSVMVDTIFTFDIGKSIQSYLSFTQYVTSLRLSLQVLCRGKAIGISADWLMCVNKSCNPIRFCLSLLTLCVLLGQMHCSGF